MRIKAVLFDLIGTTVMEKDPLAITKCFVNSFKTNDITIDPELVRKNRGKDKIEIIRNILNETKRPLNLTDSILRDYKINLERNIGNFSENEHLKELVAYLQEKKIKVGVGTGLSRDFLDKLIKHLRWEKLGFDYTGTSEETGKGRPNPDMIYYMINKFNIKNNEFLKVGDTVVDIQEGKNANVLTAAVLTGTQSDNELISQKPDFVIKSLSELKQVFQST